MGYPEKFWEVVDHHKSKMHETCLIRIQNPNMMQVLESIKGPLE